jgi:hypothetical protein
MSGHPSDLALDELVAGLPERPGTRGHVQGCESCQARLRQLEADRRSVPALPGYEATFNRVRAMAEAPPARSRWRWAFALAPVAAAAVLLLVVRPTVNDDGGERTKGSPSLFLVRPDGAPAAPPLSPGEQVSLVLQGAGRRYALVLAVDEQGRVEQLWPAGGTGSGELRAGQPEASAFEVTEGSFRLHAFFSDGPLAAEDVRATLAAAPGAEASRGRPPREHVQLDVQVRSRR